MKALLVVDVQPDFLPGGPLGVAGGNDIIPVINEALRAAPLAIATMDYHPAHHGSFVSNQPGKKPGDVIDLHGIPQVLWPDHCVQGTPGALLSDKLERQYLRALVPKGKRPEVDSYSGFFENDRKTATGLHCLLSQFEVKSLTIAGIATDYCVRATVLDAIRLGYEIAVLRRGVAGVDLQPGDSAHALEEMRAAGAIIID